MPRKASLHLQVYTFPVNSPPLLTNESDYVGSFAEERAAQEFVIAARVLLLVGVRSEEGTLTMDINVKCGLA